MRKTWIEAIEKLVQNGVRFNYSCGREATVYACMHTGTTAISRGRKRVGQHTLKLLKF
jgi:hypothetical protein